MMKVIVAGYPKTGTKSMVLALTLLGYKVYDFVEHFHYHREDWNKILTSGGTTEDFKRMYENVDAVTDGPPYYFWEEISKAFPDAKIILTTRNEDSWYKSFSDQFDMFRKKFIYQIMQVLSPTGWKYFRFCQNYARLLFGWEMTSPFCIYKPNKMTAQKQFRQHQAYCLQNAPKDRLLVYDVKQGWETLCQFLGKEIPNVRFPHKNVRGSILDEKMASDPMALQIQFEMKISLSILLTIIVGLVAALIVRLA